MISGDVKLIKFEWRSQNGSEETGQWIAMSRTINYRLGVIKSLDCYRSNKKFDGIDKRTRLSKADYKMTFNLPVNSFF